MDSAEVLAAVQALYIGHDSALRKHADSWLQSFRQLPGAWQLCLALLGQDGLRDYEYAFAAHTLRLACLKQQVTGSKSPSLLWSVRPLYIGCTA